MRAPLGPARAGRAYRHPRCAITRRRRRLRSHAGIYGTPPSRPHVPAHDPRCPGPRRRAGPRSGVACRPRQKPTAAGVTRRARRTASSTPARQRAAHMAHLARTTSDQLDPGRTPARRSCVQSRSQPGRWRRSRLAWATSARGQLTRLTPCAIQPAVAEREERNRRQAAARVGQLTSPRPAEHERHGKRLDASNRRKVPTFEAGS